jgi:hypothetical protein
MRDRCEGVKRFSFMTMKLATLYYSSNIDA